MIRDFLANGEIISVQLPYYCGTCKQDVVTVLETKSAKHGQIPAERCRQCDRALEFVEIPELYLCFLASP